MPWIPEKLFNVNLEKIGKTMMTLGIIGIISLVAATTIPEIPTYVENHPYLIYLESIFLCLGCTSPFVLYEAKK